MIIKTELLQKVSKQIAEAVEKTQLAIGTGDKLELLAKGKTLLLNVTNDEYYVTINIALDVEDSLHAIVDAKLFLNLINNITTDQIELLTDDASLSIKGNGKYKIPLVYDDFGDLLNLTEIKVANPTLEFDIGGDILNSILTFNTKELLKGNITKPTQRMFFIDNEGCITYTNGACVNTFTLQKPVKLLLNERIVKLFKLFNKTDVVHFTQGGDEENGLLITKIKLESENVKVVAKITHEDALFNEIPIKAIRGRAFSSYAHSINLDRELTLKAINRLLLFKDYQTLKYQSTAGKFTFTQNGVSIADATSTNIEKLEYVGSSLEEETTYECGLDLQVLKVTLESTQESFVTIKFGDHRGITVSYSTIVNVIPEMVRV